jgi:hypothetical protein
LRSFFSNAGKQTKPICLFSKGHSGVSGEANIEGCAIVSLGNMGVLFWRKRHSRGCRGDGTAVRTLSKSDSA